MACTRWLVLELYPYWLITGIYIYLFHYFFTGFYPQQHISTNIPLPDSEGSTPCITYKLSNPRIYAEGPEPECTKTDCSETFLR